MGALNFLLIFVYFSLKTCLGSNITHYVWKGIKAEPGEFPHQVYMGHCAGTSKFSWENFCNRAQNTVFNKTEAFLDFSIGNAH